MKELCTFDLQTVVVHIGGLNGGHYIAYCRSGKEVSHLLTDGCLQKG